MQDSKLTLRQTELLGFLDVGAADEYEQLFEQLTLGELRSLVVYLHKSLQQRSSNEAKQDVPRLRLGNVSSSADDLMPPAEEDTHAQSNSATEQGGSLTLLAVGSNISTETPRLDFGKTHDAQDRITSSQQGPVSRCSSQSLAKQSLIQRAAAAGCYSTKESLDLQLGDSIADFDLLASRLGGFGAARRSILSNGHNEQAYLAQPVSLGRALPAALQLHSSSSTPALATAYHASTDRDSTTLDSSINDAAAAPVVQLGFGSSVSSEDIDLLLPSSSSSPKEAPSSSDTARQREQDVVRQSAADMRASALAGPTSSKLDDVKEGEGEDAASDPGSNLIPAQSTPKRTAATPSMASINVGSPSSLLSTPSTVGSSVSQHIPAETPTAGGSRSGGGFGRVLFAPVNVLRKSLTEKWMPKKPGTVAAAATRAPTHGTRGAGVTPAVAGSSGSTAAAPGQSRLPSFTATAGTAGKSVRPAGRAVTPSSGYRPPSSASSWAASTVSEATVARNRSPLGKPDRPATATAAGPSRGSRLPASSGSRPAARSPASASAVTAAIPSRTGSSSSASASLAWLQQHSELPASSPAQSCGTSGAGGGRSGSRQAGQSPAAEAAAAAVIAAGARSKSGTATPPGSRPGTSQSTRSAASNATYAGSSTSPAPANSSRIPGFAVTQQMVAGKQQRSTPPSSARTAPPGSARSAASAATTTSAASFMRQISGAGGVGGVAARRVASIGGTDRQQQQQMSSPFAGTGSRTPAGTALTGTAARQGSGRCNGLLGQASSNRVGPGAVSGTGRTAAVGGAAQLRRSRSFGSLGELKQQNGHQDVAHIRQMWQKRAVEQQQMQQQQLVRQGSRGSSTAQHGIRSPAAATQPRVSRIPSVTLPQQTSAAVGHGIPEPEECDSPPVQQQRRASSSSGYDANAAAVGHHPASDLLGRIDDIIQKARTPTDRAASVGAHTAPHSAPPAAAYPSSTPSAAAGVQPSIFTTKLSGMAGADAADQAGGVPAAAMSAAAHTPASVCSKVAGTPDSGYSKYSLDSSQASHTPGGVACFGISAKQQQTTPADSSSAGRDQQLTTDAEGINRQLF